LSGIIGVPLGSLWSTKWRPKNQRADPLICGTGLALSSIFLCISLFLCNSYFILAFVMIFLGEISLNLNWSIVADILLYVVVPTRRGTAEAIQILFSHLFGDAGSPYLIGIVSDSLKQNTVVQDRFCLPIYEPHFRIADNGNKTVLCNDVRDFYSMQYSLVVNILIVFLGAICFFISAIFIIKDKDRVERFVAEAADEYKAEKEDMILKSDSNSTWSSEDDVPPQIIVNSQHNSKKLEPLLEPLKYNKPTKA